MGLADSPGGKYAGVAGGIGGSGACGDISGSGGGGGGGGPALTSSAYYRRMRLHTASTLDLPVRKFDSNRKQNLCAART